MPCNASFCTVFCMSSPAYTSRNDTALCVQPANLPRLPCQFVNSCICTSCINDSQPTCLVTVHVCCLSWTSQLLGGLQVLLNGRTSSLSHGTAAYVTQDDVLIGSLTVLECMMFVARLRLPSSMSNADKQAKVHQILSEMGLLGCKDTFIGAWPAKGISGEMSNSTNAPRLLSKIPCCHTTIQLKARATS